MTKSFLTIFATGLLAVGLLSFTEEYHPQEMQKQEKKKTEQQIKTDPADTPSNMDRRSGKKASGLRKTDSVPPPPVPLPDSIGRGMH